MLARRAVISILMTKVTCGVMMTHTIIMANMTKPINFNAPGHQ